MKKLGVADHFKSTLYPLEITYIPTGQKILFRGLDDGMKITSISVENGVLCFVWIEEAFEMTNEDDFNKLDMSIRGEMPEGLFKQITLTLNPWSGNSWIKHRFFDKPDSNVFTKTTTWKCNEWLDEKDREIFIKLEKENSQRARVECFGEWGLSKGLIFENFEIRNFDTEKVKRKSNVKTSFSLDFGFTDPNAFICALVDFDDSIIYVFDEWYKANVTNKEIAEAIKNMGFGGQSIICDSAEPKSIRELRQRGIKAVPANKGKDSVNYGIQYMQNFKFIILPKCRHFAEEIQNYVWIKSGNESYPCHKYSHGMDSLRYGMIHLSQGDNFSFI